MNLRRVVKGISASVFDKLANLVIQLSLVPVLASHWGLSTYGGWILLATVPSFIAMGDLGLATAAGVRMTMLVAEGQSGKAIKTYHSAWALITLASTALLALIIIFATFTSASWLPSSAQFSPHQSRLTLVALMMYGLAALQGSIVVAGFRCTGNFPWAVFGFTLTAIFENGVALCAVLAGGGPLSAAFALAMGRTIGLIGQYAALRKMAPWLSLGFKGAEVHEMRLLASPAAAVMALPLGQACVLQGAAIALGAAVSQAAVPVFTATRTLSRIGIQLALLVNNAIMPEFSIAVAKQDRTSQAAIIISTIASTTLLALPFGLLLIMFGPTIMLKWTGGRVIAPSLVISMMAISMMLGAVWSALGNLLLSMNKHASFSYSFAVISLLFLPICFLMARELGILGAAISVVAVDVAMCAIVMRSASQLLISRSEIVAFVANSYVLVVRRMKK